MSNASSAGPVVVGIDGSKTAISAARWAIDEAISRDVPLRLVHVTHVETAAVGPDDDFRLETQYAETALRAASTAVQSTGKPVKVEAAAPRGDVVGVLAAESVGASMICVGSVGIGWLASKVLGSTAAALAKHAHSSVAIIRSDRDAPPSDSGFIAVVVNDDPDNDKVVQTAMEEARLRDASVLAVGAWPWLPAEVPYDALARRMGDWARRYPEVNIQPVAARTGAAHYLEKHTEPVQLAVVGNAYADQVTRLIGPHGQPLVGHAGCSVLVVRD